MNIIEHAKEAAQEEAGNWRKFESFVWHDKPEDAEKYAHVSLGMSRDADTLIQSNHRIAKGRLETVDEEQEHWTNEHQGHWAVGWIDLFSIRCLDDQGEPTPAWVEWCTIQVELENYPILDEDDFTELEQEEAQAVWKNCYNSKERLQYIEKNRSQFEFHSFADMLGCVRGNYFGGYASELIQG